MNAPAAPSTVPVASVRAAVYLRISSDREGEELGVGRQREDCLAKADRFGWTVAEHHIFTDNDRGASEYSRKKRKAYAAMLAAAERREFDVILAYSNSRLTRRSLEFHALIDLYRRTGIKIATVVSGDDDLDTADGRFVAKVKADADAAVAERTSELVRRVKLAHGAAGRPSGGQRPFGYRVADKLTQTLDPVEAEALSGAAGAFLAGTSLRAIALEWNGRGLTTANGGRWDSSGVAQVLARPRNAGLIGTARHGARAAHIVGPATWPPILDRETWEAVCRKLDDPARRQQRSTSRRLLGSYLYVCGVCGAKLGSGGAGARGHDRYACTAAKPCLRRSAALIDATVLEAVAERLGGLTLPAREGPDVRAERARLAAFRAARATLDEALAVPAEDGPPMTLARWRELVALNESKQAELRAIIAAAEEISPLSGIADADDAAAAFRAADPDRQRAVIDRLAVVRVMPAPSGRHPFDPATVQIGWKGV